MAEDSDVKNWPYFFRLSFEQAAVKFDVLSITVTIQNPLILAKSYPSSI